MNKTNSKLVETLGFGQLRTLIITYPEKARHYFNTHLYETERCNADGQTLLMRCVIIRTTFTELYYDRDAIEFLLQQHCHINARDYKGQTALHLAIESKPVVNLVSLFNWIFEDLGDEDLYFTHPRIKELRGEIVQLLIKNGANVNLPDRSGYTPLILAIKTRNYDAAKQLINAGSEINHRDAKNVSALHYAILQRNTHLVDLLIENGAKMTSNEFTNYHNDELQILVDQIKIAHKGVIIHPESDHEN